MTHHAAPPPAFRALLTAVVVGIAGWSATRLAAASPYPVPAKPAPVASSVAGKLVGGYEGFAFRGGRLRFTLEQDGPAVAQYVHNDYDVPVTIDFSADYTGLSLLWLAHTQVLPPHSRHRLADFRSRTNERFQVDSHFFAMFGDPRTQATPYRYALPFLPGESYAVIQGFDGDFSHTGSNRYAVDFGMPVGTRVTAARSGIVVAYHDQATSGGTDPNYLALDKVNWVLVRHEDGTVAEYAHLMPGGVKVSVGQRVGRGELLGLSGKTGYASVPHLHFSVYTAESGQSKRTFPFVMQTSPDDPKGQAPKKGERYTAFRPAETTY